MQAKGTGKGRVLHTATDTGKVIIKFDTETGIISYGTCLLKLAKPKESTTKKIEDILNGRTTEAKVGSSWSCDQKISLTENLLSIVDRAVDSNPVLGWSLSIHNTADNGQLVKAILYYLAGRSLIE